MLKRNVIVISLVVLAVAAALLLLRSPQEATGKDRLYGKPLDAKAAQTVPLATLFAKTADFAEKQVIVEGQIGQVCQTSGCWITLTDGTNQLFVQFYDFTVRIKPGTKVKASGQVRVRNKAPYLAASGLEVLS